MTLIMNNLAFSISVFAMLITLLLTYLRVKIELDDKKQREARYTHMRKLFEEKSIYYKEYDDRFQTIHGR